MANRLNYFFQQLVSESELDLGFAYLETAIWDLANDFDLSGICTGLGITEQGSPDLTVQANTGTAYDKDGKRLRVPSPQTVDCSVDYLNVTTAVSTVGKAKWVSIFLLFDRTLSDPRVDGNTDTVYFDVAEAFTFKVVQSVEDVTPTRPSLEASGILLADLYREYGQTTFTNGDVNTERREVFFAFTGDAIQVSETTPKNAFTALSTIIENHLQAGGHTASLITYGGGGNWANGTTNPGTTVELQLDNIVSQLASTTTSSSGSRKTGSEAQTVGSFTLSAGTLFSQLTSIITFINTLDTTVGKLAGTQTFTGAKTFDNVTVSAGNKYKLSSRSITRAFNAGIAGGTGWILATNLTGLAFRCTVDTGEYMYFPVDFPHGAELNGGGVVAYVKGGSGYSPFPGGAPANKIKAALGYTTISTGVQTELVADVASTMSTAGTYEAIHAITVPVNSTHTVDRATRQYWCRIKSESGANALVNNYAYGVLATCTVTTQDEW